MSIRRLRILFQNLPAESATMTALRNSSPAEFGAGGDAAEGRWSQAEMLLAAVVDELAVVRWLYHSVHTDKKELPPPTPIRRPGGDPNHGKPRWDPAQAQFLFNHINGLPQDGVHLTVIQGDGGS